MQLREALAAAGMTPPTHIVPGRWMRFPGIGKGRSNRAGWCRLILPTLAVYGDWSTGLSEIWRDGSHLDDEHSRRLLAEARERERQFSREQHARRQAMAKEARAMIEKAKLDRHPYLASKGFPSLKALVYGEQLLVPMRDVSSYKDVINCQLISPDGTKRFLTGGRAGGAVYASGPLTARYTVLCEGYATGLSIESALKRLPGPHRIVVCFSALNLERVASHFTGATVAADNDLSGTGERAAEATGLKWTMPYEVGTDFNDLHQTMGLHVVVERMRELLAS